MTLGCPSRSPRRQLAAALATVSLMLGACANTYDMKVDSLASPKLAQGTSYRIVNRNPTVETDSLRYKEAEKAIKAALSGKGFYEAPDPDKADIIVYVDYGINPPRIVEETRSDPVYVTTPGEFHSESVQVGVDRTGRPIYAVVTSQTPPSTDVVGNNDYTVPVVVYEKYLRLSARENKPATEGRQPQEVWAVDVTSEGPSDNLRKYVPIMAAATIGYIGKDTSGEKVVQLKDDKDGDLAFVKKGM